MRHLIGIVRVFGTANVSTRVISTTGPSCPNSISKPVSITLQEFTHYIRGQAPALPYRPATLPQPAPICASCNSRRTQ